MTVFNFNILYMSESGSESSHKSIIDKKTKTKEGKYLGDRCLHTNTLR